MIITQRVKTSGIIAATWWRFLLLVLLYISSYLFHNFILRNLLQFPAIIQAFLGPALAFFIGFNNNQAYDRWLEVRKVWCLLVKDYRPWARQIMYYQTSDYPEDIRKIEKANIGTIHLAIRLIKTQYQKQFYNL